MTRINVDDLKGQATLYISVRPDNQDRNRIFYSGPNVASLTRQQALDLANALADTLEGL